MRLISYLFALLLFASCMFPEKGPLFFKTDDKELSTVSPIIAGKADYDFKTLYEHIIKPKCLSCHQGASALPVNDPIDLSSYKLITQDRFIPIFVKGKPDRSRLFITVYKGEMPPKTPLEPEEVAYIKKWIELCGPDTTKDGCQGSGSDQSDDEPSDDEPSDDEPSDDEPSDDEPSDDEPSDDEPSDDEPSDDEPSDDEPSDDEP